MWDGFFRFSNKGSKKLNFYNMKLCYDYSSEKKNILVALIPLFRAIMENAESFYFKSH